MSSITNNNNNNPERRLGCSQGSKNQLLQTKLLSLNGVFHLYEKSYSDLNPEEEKSLGLWLKDWAAQLEVPVEENTVEGGKWYLAYHEDKFVGAVNIDVRNEPSGGIDAGAGVCCREQETWMYNLVQPRTRHPKLRGIGTFLVLSVLEKMKDRPLHLESGKNAILFYRKIKQKYVLKNLKIENDKEFNIRGTMKRGANKKRKAAALEA